MATRYGNNVLAMSKLLEKEDATIFQVLVNSGLSSSIRTCLPQFISFIMTSESINAILDICLTTKYKEDPTYSKMLRGAISVLTSTSTGLMSRVMMNQTYIQRMTEFMEKGDVHNPEICGNYFSIFDGMTKYTRGGFIDDIPNFSMWLIENCYTYSFRELLSNFMIDYPSKFTTESTIDRIAQLSGSESGLFSTGAALVMLKSKPQYISLFSRDSVVEELLKTAVKSDIQREAVINALKLLIAINKSGFMISEEQLDEYSQLFFNQKVVMRDDVLCQALKIFKCKEHSILLRIFDSNTSSLIKESLVVQFKNTDDDSLMKFIEEEKVIEKIVELYPNRGYNSSLLLLIQYLKKFTFNVDGWSSVLEDTSKRCKMINTPYGGETPFEERPIFEYEDEPKEEVKERSISKDSNMRSFPRTNMQMASFLTSSLEKSFAKSKKVKKESKSEEEEEESYGEVTQGLPEGFGIV